jgi:hypothetical protein
MLSKNFFDKNNFVITLLIDNILYQINSKMSLGCFRILYNFISVVPVSSIHPEEKEREREM